jgi:hypothetical protein
MVAQHAKIVDLSSQSIPAALSMSTEIPHKVRIEHDIGPLRDEMWSRTVHAQAAAGANVVRVVRVVRSFMCQDKHVMAEHVGSSCTRLR